MGLKRAEKYTPDKLIEKIKDEWEKPTLQFTDAMKEEIFLHAKNGVPFAAMCEIMALGDRRLAYGRLRSNREAYVLYKIGVYKANSEVAGWLFDNCRPKYKRVKSRDENGKLVKDSRGDQVWEYQKVKEGDVSAQKYWLQTRGGWNMMNNIFPDEEDMENTVDENTVFDKLSEDEKRILTSAFRKLEGGI